MVDCRNLIEFCKAFDHHRNKVNPLPMTDQSSYHPRNNNHNNRHKKHTNNSCLSHQLCDQSPFLALDIVILFLVLGAFGFLTVPYLLFLCQETAEILADALFLIGDVVYQAPVAYATVVVLMFVTVIAGWEIFHHLSRKCCGNPRCKGLRKAAEFHIQLESEECVKYLPPMPKDAIGAGLLELGQDHRELEAELKRLAPLNGRAVLIFWSPCGCPAGRMEVWGPKKLRRIKK